MTNGKSINGLAKKQVFTTGEAAELCKVSQQTIIRCFDAGRLQGFRVPGSRFRRIPRADLIRFMQQNDIPTDLLESPAKRILLVDDDPQIIEVLRDAFNGDERFEVRSATTGYDAGLLTEQFRPHLILLDYMLPDINGNVVCQRIRSNDRLKHTKIMIVSGVINQQEIDAMLKQGADDFIKKPFDLDTLMDRISTMVNVKK
jgi:excisionase family DNA binding protein